MVNHSPENLAVFFEARPLKCTKIIKPGGVNISVCKILGIRHYSTIASGV